MSVKFNIIVDNYLCLDLLVYEEGSSFGFLIYRFCFVCIRYDVFRENYIVVNVDSNKEK